MAARYFFHADDEAQTVYGPVPIETLRRWRTEGRLRDDSRLRAEDSHFYTSAKKVLSAPTPPPLPEPAVTEFESDAPPLIPAPSRIAAPAEAIPVTRLIANTLPRYGEAVRRLWWIAALTQIPLFSLTLLMPGHVDPQTGAMSPRFAVAFLGLVGAAMIFTEFGFALMALGLHPLPNAASPGQRFAFLARKAGAILWTLFVRLVLVGALFIIFGFCLVSAHAAPPSPVLRFPLYFFSSLSGLAATILLLRYLPSTLVVLFEGKKGLGALRRSGELVRFNQGNGLISPGDFRLVLMILPSIAAQIFFGWIISRIPLAALPGWQGHLADASLAVVSAALTLPLYTILVVSYYVDALPRVPRETAKDETK